MTFLWLLGCLQTDSKYQDGPLCEWEVESIDEQTEINCTNNRCDVPDGAFIMGSNQGAEDQCPIHQWETNAFIIDQREVTKQQYDICVNQGECTESPFCPSAALDQTESNLPITCVSWEQANDYCIWNGGRLPTEAEWEKAARGLSGIQWPWGDTPPNCAIANFRYSSAYCAGGVIEVGSFERPDPLLTSIEDSRSPFGLLDAAGNAWEWVADDYDARAFELQATGRQETGCAIGATDEWGDCLYKVIKGGGFNTFQDMTRTSARGFMSPEGYDDNIGFRCAYDEVSFN